jgi:hypothetical protein
MVGVPHPGGQGAYRPQVAEEELKYFIHFIVKMIQVLISIKYRVAFTKNTCCWPIKYNKFFFLVLLMKSYQEGTRGCEETKSAILPRYFCSSQRNIRVFSDFSDNAHLFTVIG